MIGKLIIVSMLVCPTLLGQPVQRTDSVSTLSVVTDPPGADLYVDSLFVGKSPVQSISLHHGNHRIRAFYPSMFSWNATLTEDSLDIATTGNFEKHIVLGKALRVQSTPPGSTVLLEGRSLGVTPLYLSGISSSAGELIVRKIGYDSVVVPFSEIKEGLLRLQLRHAGGLGADASDDGVRGPDLMATDHWSTYASGLTMIVSGVTSAYLKDRANKEFDKYLLTKNPASLSKTNTLDRGSAICLVVSQVSFIVLSYLLLSD